MSPHHRSRLLFVVASLALALAFTGQAAAQIVTTIDFESVPGVNPTPSFFQLTDAPLDSYLSDQLLETHGVSLYSESPNPAAVAYIQLGLGHATSGEFGVGSIDTQSRIDYTIPLMASFFVKENPTQSAITDIVSIMADQASCCETLTLEAYDANGDYLTSTTATAVPGGTTLEVTHPGIHTIRVRQESGTVAWDDLSFGTLTPVPEPSSLILATLAVAAFARRRRAT